MFWYEDFNYYPNYSTRRLYFGEVETPYYINESQDHVVLADIDAQPFVASQKLVNFASLLRRMCSPSHDDVIFSTSSLDQCDKFKRDFVDVISRRLKVSMRTVFLAL